MEKIGLLILFLIININPLWAEEANTTAVKEQANIEISYEKDLLSVHARSVSLKELFEEISKKTKIEVVLDKEAGEQKIGVEFKQLSIKKGIEKIIDLTGLKDLAISYKEKSNVGAIGQSPKYEIAKIEIRKRNKEDIAKAKDVKQVKNREIVSVNKGKNNIPIRYVKDEILLKFHFGVTANEIDEILKKYNLVKSNDNGLSKVGYIKAKIPDGRDVISVIKEIRKEYKLKIPEPNYIVNVLTVTDPLYSNQWYIPEINFDKAWGVAKSTAVVKIAVIDTGIDGEHPDLKGKILEGYNFVSGTTDVSDDNGHGTFVAGIVAAAHNEIGVKGLYDYAQIIPVKVIDANGLGTYEDVARGILYAADNGAKVINMSIGGYAYSYMLQQAVDYALEKGCIVVAAGGNDGIEQEIFPASYPDVIGVSALGYNGQIWIGSNSGKHIDVCAPGVNIISTGLNSDYVYSTGTSASAPMVSALAAMLVSEKPDLSSSYIERLFIQSAKDLGDAGRDNIYGKGKIDAHAALEQ
ncbi:MAG: S8 family peptidase, partial [bacterium]